MATGELNRGSLATISILKPSSSLIVLIDSSAERAGDLENSSFNPTVSTEGFLNVKSLILPPEISCRKKTTSKGIEKRMAFIAIKLYSIILKCSSSRHTFIVIDLNLLNIQAVGIFVKYGG